MFKKVTVIRTTSEISKTVEKFRYLSIHFEAKVLVFYEPTSALLPKQ